MLVRHRTITPTFDRTFEQLANSFFESRGPSAPDIDGAWTDDEYVMTIDLPGVPADAVSVEVADHTLTLGAKTDRLEWQRSVRLGGRLDPDKVRAHHVDGRLTVRIGTIDEPVARMVQIDTSAPELAIEASSDDADDTSNVDQSTETTDTE